MLFIFLIRLISSKKNILIVQFLFLASKDPVCHLPFLDNITDPTIENANVLPKGNLPLTFSDGWNTENQVLAVHMRGLLDLGIAS